MVQFLVGAKMMTIVSTNFFIIATNIKLYGYFVAYKFEIRRIMCIFKFVNLSFEHLLLDNLIFLLIVAKCLFEIELMLPVAS